MGTFPTGLGRRQLAVVGLGRCGTSLLMQMLHRAGVPCVGTYPAFEEPLAQNPAWLLTWPGHAFKWLDPHKSRMERPEGIPPLLAIWLDRDPRQQAKSQCKMLRYADPKLQLSRNAEIHLERRLRTERVTAQRALQRVAHDVVTLRFEQVINDPVTASLALSGWLSGHGVAVDAAAMAGVVLSRPASCMRDMSIEETQLRAIGALVRRGLEEGAPRREFAKS